MKPYTLFREAIETLQPGATGSQAAALLDNRTTRYGAINWMTGKAQAPQWAIELIAEKLEARAQQPMAIACELRKLPPRPGLSAGAKNLAAYLARRT